MKIVTILLALPLVVLAQTPTPSPLTVETEELDVVLELDEDDSCALPTARGFDSKNPLLNLVLLHHLETKREDDLAKRSQSGSTEESEDDDSFPLLEPLAAPLSGFVIPRAMPAPQVRRLGLSCIPDMTLGEDLRAGFGSLSGSNSLFK